MLWESKIKAGTFCFLSDNSTMLPEIGMKEQSKKTSIKQPKQLNTLPNKQTNKQRTNTKQQLSRKHVKCKFTHRRGWLNHWMHPEGMTRHCTKLPTYLTLSSWNCTSICLPESWLISFSCFSLKALYSNFISDSSLSADCRTMRKSWTSLVNTVKKPQNNLHVIWKTVLDIGHRMPQNLLGSESAACFQWN